MVHILTKAKFSLNEERIVRELYEKNKGYTSFLKLNLYFLWDDKVINEKENLLIKTRERFIKKIYEFPKSKNFLKNFESVNLLKSSMKFDFFDRDNFCRVIFKHTGVNNFGIIVSENGRTLFFISAGFFKGVNKRKAKLGASIPKLIGEMVSLRLYKSQCFRCIFTPVYKLKDTLSNIQSFLNGFSRIRFVSIYMIFLRVKVMRNGVRLKKKRRI